MIICSVNGRKSRIYENPDTEDDYDEGYVPVVVLLLCYSYCCNVECVLIIGLDISSTP